VKTKNKIELEHGNNLIKDALKREQPKQRVRGGQKTGRDVAGTYRKKTERKRDCACGISPTEGLGG